MAKLETLDRQTHQHLRVREENAFSVCKDLNMCAVVASEIARLVIQYPIVFTKNGETGQFVCVALFGFDPTQNLFWQQDRWEGYCVPLNVGRQPFFVGLADAPGGASGGQKSLVTCIDVENPGIHSTDGELLFDAAGNETPYLRHKLAMLAELVDGENKTRAFIEKLLEFELIQPIQLELKAPGIESRKIGGLHSIEEKKLRALDAAQLADLNARGYLHAMYAQLSSLGHLQILARRSGAARLPSANA